MTEQQPLNTAPLPLKLKVEDYLLLDGSGAFDDYNKTELIDGEVYFMNAQHRPHARTKTRLAVALDKALERFDGLEAVVEASVEIPPYNVPEPDIVVTNQPDGEGLIPLASVRLVIEVADCTVQNDLTRKAGIYAAAGVPEYWVVDLPDRKIHQFWLPEGEAYAERHEWALGERIETATIAGLAVETHGV